MEATLNYLETYRKGITILTDDEIYLLDENVFPKSWKEIFVEKEFASRKKIVLNNWAICATALRNTIKYLNEHLLDVQISYFNDKYSILYYIKNSKGNTLIYEGQNPFDKEVDFRLKNAWPNLPKSITDFYDHVHNGFYYFASESMGLSPIESVINLDDLEWGILEDIEEPIKIDLKNSYGFFTNGMGGYVVVDSNNSQNNNATLWWSNKPPRYHVNFWDLVDEWIVIGFEN